MMVKATGRQILRALKEPLMELLLTDSEHRPRLQATSTVLNSLFIAGASINVRGSSGSAGGQLIESQVDL